jgi:Lon protease-like protein
MPSDYPEGEFLLPLFPLPNLVFFPQTRLPLHVFEPRYRALVADALVAEKRIGMILLKPGWEENYFGSPDLHAFGTVGLIEQAVALEEGKYNLVLNGIVRFRLLEQTSETPYRVARVVADPETPADATETWAQKLWLTDLSRQYLESMSRNVSVPEINTASLESLTNALIMSLNIEVDQKQELLEESRLAARGKRVADLLEERLTLLKFLEPYRKEGDPTSN